MAGRATRSSSTLSAGGGWQKKAALLAGSISTLAGAMLWYHSDAREVCNCSCLSNS